MSANEEVFGAGIALDESMDIVVDNTGDLDATYGIDELEKDLAFRLKIRMEGDLGSRLTKTQEKILSVKSSRIVQQDPRIDGVDNVTAQSNSLRDEMEISIDVLANDGTTYSFVVPVGE